MWHDAPSRARLLCAGLLTPHTVMHWGFRARVSDPARGHVRSSVEGASSLFCLHNKAESNQKSTESTVGNPRLRSLASGSHANGK